MAGVDKSDDLRSNGAGGRQTRDSCEARDPETEKERRFIKIALLARRFEPCTSDSGLEDSHMRDHQEESRGFPSQPDLTPLFRYLAAKTYFLITRRVSLFSNRFSLSLPLSSCLAVLPASHSFPLFSEQKMKMMKAE